MANSPVESLDYFLTTTKQVRRRLDLTRQVPTDVVLECIDLASRAPIGGNLERNRWLLIDDPETRSTLADLYSRFGRGYLEAGQKQIESMGNDPTATRVVESSLYLLEHLHEVPLMIIPIKLDRPGTSTFEQATYWGSVTPGVWSLQLALRARGIGSAWTTLHLHHEEDAAELLDLPASVTQIALLPTAYFTGDGFQPARRRRAQEITYYNRWKEPVPETT
ncbi:MAG TPA: nitroreductase [Gammaproteobacteria bacterium]|uniref:Nitroreductase domain-containing protein n=1 Tax=marine metagenome TaxID=408172 RepID=A0A381Q929_9ZZZZ|nr:nitroreductase [Gammaproteobacteria bacterium]HCP48932.1 nitroreductase [Gammaproteobacteria bacterium]|tara:strand:+ start:630 stop:1292 length:663 start_codon:yes stop_codon:yes gene_type:complete